MVAVALPEQVQLDLLVLTFSSGPLQVVDHGALGPRRVLGDGGYRLPIFVLLQPDSALVRRYRSALGHDLPLDKVLGNFGCFK